MVLRGSARRIDASTHKRPFVFHSKPIPLSLSFPLAQFDARMEVFVNEQRGEGEECITPRPIVMRIAFAGRGRVVDARPFFFLLDSLQHSEEKRE